MRSKHKWEQVNYHHDLFVCWPSPCEHAVIFVVVIWTDPVCHSLMERQLQHHKHFGFCPNRQHFVVEGLLVEGSILSIPAHYLTTNATALWSGRYNLWQQLVQLCHYLMYCWCHSLILGRNTILVWTRTLSKPATFIRHIFIRVCEVGIRAYSRPSILTRWKRLHERFIFRSVICQSTRWLLESGSFSIVISV